VEGPSFNEIGEYSIKKVNFKCRVLDPSEQTQSLIDEI
jgi:hypothetical protein